MTRMQRLWPKVRAAALLGAGSIMVHELRYVAGYGADAGKALAEQGHGYLPLVEALVIVISAAALGRFAMSLANARRGVEDVERPPSLGRLWLLASAALAVVYTLQEGFEGTFDAGHPAGLIGIFGHGGWTALLFSLAVGAAIAALTRVAYQAIELVARQAARRRKRAPARPSWAPPAMPPGGRRLDVLALNLAGRAPPRPTS
jgi:hypothetical protein